MIRLASGSVNFASPVGPHTFDIILIYKGQQEVSRRMGVLCYTEIQFYLERFWPVKEQIQFTSFVLYSNTDQRIKFHFKKGTYGVNSNL